MDIKTLSQSRGFRIAVISLGVILVALTSFSAGVSVGLRKAKFSYAFGENYERTFGMGPAGSGKKGMGAGSAMMPFDADDRDFRNGHGLVGEIISVADGSIIVEDLFGKENTVVLDDDVVVRNGRDVVLVSALTPGDRVAIIGNPNDERGRVVARLIRILPPPPANNN